MTQGNSETLEVTMKGMVATELPKKSPINPFKVIKSPSLIGTGLKKLEMNKNDTLYSKDSQFREK